MSSAREWQAQGTYFTLSNGHRVFYQKMGRGRPLLFLHGYPTSSHDYSKIAPLLADKYDLIFFDFLGFGFSDKPAAHTYSLFEQAEIAEQLAAYLGLGSLYVVAHDMGASVALELLRRGNLQVNKLVLMNGSLLLKYYQPVVTQRLLLHPTTGPLLSRLNIGRRQIFDRQFSSVFAKKPTAAELDDFFYCISYNDGYRIQYRLIQYLRERMINELIWLDALQIHAAPLTIIWGQQDPVAVPRIAQELVARRPDATYVPLHDIGHYLQWEAPQMVASTIRSAFWE